MPSRREVFSGLYKKPIGMVPEGVPEPGNNNREDPLPNLAICASSSVGCGEGPLQVIQMALQTLGG